MSGDPAAGPASGASELRLRVISALVLAIAVIGATLLGGWAFRLVWIAVAGLVAYEWLTVSGSRDAVAGGVGVVGAGLALAFVPVSVPALVGASALAALIGAILTTLVGQRRLLELCGIAYALAFALITPALRDIPALGLPLIIWTFATVWLTDIAAYFTGRALGGPKLMPRVSPKKTWSGALGGTAAGTLAGYLVLRFAPGMEGVFGAWAALAASLFASIASQAGDLFESALKRRFGAKDSGHLIPGHGGFLDRLDGYWAVIVFAGAVLFLARSGS